MTSKIKRLNLALMACCLLPAIPSGHAEVIQGLTLLEPLAEAIQTPAKAGSSPFIANGSPSFGVAGEMSSTRFTPEIEPNNTAAQATAIPAAAAIMQGNVFPNADVDYYAFTASAGDRIYAATATNLSGNGSSDSVLDLIDADGSTILETDDSDGSFGSTSSSIAGATIPANGTYYLRVKHFSATSQLRPYRLFFQLRSGLPTPESGVNDTYPGLPLPTSGWISGTTSAATDLDFYALDLMAGDTVFISLDLDPERDTVEWNGRLGMGTFDSNILVVNDGGTATPDSEAFFLTVKESGTYGILIDSGDAATFGSYQASVSVFPHADDGLNCTTYYSADVPVAIPTGPGMITSTLTIPGNPVIADLDVGLDLQHNLMQDLDIELTAPGGNTVGLLSDIGSSTVGTNVNMNILLDDEAAIPSTFTVVNGLTLAPEYNYRLAWFDGQPAGGAWTLKVHDDTASEGGTLNGWSLRICEPVAQPRCPAKHIQTTRLTTDFEAGAAGFTHSGAPLDEWELGTPALAPIAECNSGTQCFKTDLDGTYDASGSQELLSPTIDLTGLAAPVIVNWAHKYQVESASFDTYAVTAREVANPGNAVELFQHFGPTMTNTIGNPATTTQEAAGWGTVTSRIDALAGLNVELRYLLNTDSSVQLGGIAVDDVSVTACLPVSDDRDANVDRKADLLWRNGTTGEFTLWQMNGTGTPAFKGFGAIPTAWQIAESRADFNADGKSDLFWRNTSTGELTLWQMNGTASPSFKGFGTLASSWQLVQSRGDFNGDYKADLFWWNSSTGELSLWQMNGTGAPSFKGFGTLPPADWQLVESRADFNGDGKSDLFWRSTASGALSLWQMNGTGAPTFKGFGTLAADWQVKESNADYNADGKADLLWRNASTGELSLWLMSGASTPTIKGFGIVALPWQLLETRADYNGDGIADLLWWHSGTGEVSLWQMNGSGPAAFKSFGVIASTWQLPETLADYDGDGKHDLLWRNTATGEVQVWLMNGTATPTFKSFGTLASTWQIQDSDADYNADGKDDILWRNTTTNEVYLWQMNGASSYSGKSFGVVSSSWALQPDQ